MDRYVCRDAHSKAQYSFGLIQSCWLQVHKPASADNNRADIIFLRDYEHGVMSNESVLRIAGKDNHRKAIKKDRSRKIQEKKTDLSLPKAGEHIFKGHRSYDLMRELQLGIMFSIANATKSRVSLTAQDVTQEAFGLEVSHSCTGQSGILLGTSLGILQLLLRLLTNLTPKVQSFLSFLSIHVMRLISAAYFVGWTV